MRVPPAASLRRDLQRRGLAVREAARLVTQAGNNMQLGRVLLNLCDVSAVTDLMAAAEAARSAVHHLRRTGAWDYLAHAITNLVQAQRMPGDRDSADEQFTWAVESEGLGDIGDVACCRGWLAALHGDAQTAETLLAGLQDLRASEDVRDTSLISLAEAFAAAARGRREDALSNASDTRARLTGHDDPAAGEAFVAAVSGLRTLSTPYHLAQGPLNHARQLRRGGDHAAAAAAIGEARDIASRMRCQPLLDRITALTPAALRVGA